MHILSSRESRGLRIRELVHPPHPALGGEQGHLVLHLCPPSTAPLLSSASSGCPFLSIHLISARRKEAPAGGRTGQLGSFRIFPRPESLLCLLWFQAFCSDPHLYTHCSLWPQPRGAGLGLTQAGIPPQGLGQGGAFRNQEKGLPRADSPPECALSIPTPPPRRTCPTARRSPGYGFCVRSIVTSWRAG